MEEPAAEIDVAVIGGGLAGLAAAAFAARAGASVRVLEARSGLGGRGRTSVHDGFHFNEGPHALYKASSGVAVLRELGIVAKGASPPLVHTRFSLDGTLRRVPPRRAVAQVLRLVRGLGKDRHDPGLIHISAQEWIAGRVTDPVGRQLASSLVRVSSYSGDLSTFSADGAASQLHDSLRGVTYLHGGWRQLVDALDAAARAATAEIDTHAKATTLGVDGDRLAVGLGDGRRLVARAVVIASGGPRAATRLVGGASASLEAAATAAAPVHAACLDLGLRRLSGATRFVLGVDQPTYASVHTPGARLADHGHVVHLMHYEPLDESDVEIDVGVDAGRLEALADEVQPGWRSEEAARQVGLRRVVAFDRPRPGSGMAGRPRHSVDDLPGVFVAGDWVGPTDLLGAAAITSGKAAGLAAAAWWSTRHRRRGPVSDCSAPSS